MTDTFQTRRESYRGLSTAGIWETGVMVVEVRQGGALKVLVKTLVSWSVQLLHRLPSCSIKLRCW